MDLEIVKGYVGGKSAMRLAEEFGLKSWQVYEILKKNEVRRRSNRENSRRFDVNHNFFAKIDSEEKAYWLGFLYADGHIIQTDGSKKVVLAISQKDFSHLKKFSSSLESTYPIHTYTNKTSYGDTEYCRIVISSEKMFDDLNALGCVPNKTLKIEPPHIDEIWHRDFIRGYVDGDGSIAKSKDAKGGYRLKIIGTYAMMKWMSAKIPRTGKIGECRGMATLEAHISGAFYLYDDSSIYLNRKKIRIDTARSAFKTA